MLPLSMQNLDTVLWIHLSSCQVGSASPCLPHSCADVVVFQNDLDEARFENGIEAKLAGDAEEVEHVDNKTSTKIDTGA